MGEEVEPVTTPLAPTELATVLSWGHAAATGAPPSYQRLGVAWAWCMLETGRGAMCRNNNVGNIGTGSGWPGDWYELPTPGEPHFRAYTSAKEGATDYWRQMATTFASALPYFDAGDPKGAALELAKLGYYTAPPEVIWPAVVLLYEEWKRTVPEPSLVSAKTPESVVNWIVGAALVAAVLFGGYIALAGDQ